MKINVQAYVFVTIITFIGCTRISDKILDNSASADNASGNTGAVSTSTTAIRVYGQAGSFTSNGVNNGGSVTANTLNRPTAVAVDSTGLYVAENQNMRVTFFSGSSTTATRVYGQAGSFTTNTFNMGGATSNTTVGSPVGLGLDSGGLYIAEFHYRVTYFSGVSTTALRVYGQGGSFTTATQDNGGVTANSLDSCAGVWHDGSGVYISDYANNRVLYYSGTATTATRVYGQGGSFTSQTANNGGITANSLSTPYAVVSDASGVYIADSANNRVLFYSGTSTTASRVYGQNGSFTDGTANNGGITATSLSGPGALRLDTAGLYVSDSNNHRILFFPGTSTTATRVYGQGGSFTSGTLNNGGVSANSLNTPAGLAIYNGNLYVADQYNHRVLVY